MRLVISMLTLQKISDKNKNDILNILIDNYNYKMEIYTFNYDDRVFHEVDIDIFNIHFKKKKLYTELNKLINICENILINISNEIDFIISNDDTDAMILCYEKDINDIGDFGLFITKRIVPNLKPYYSSDICNAYVNLKHTSFGIYD